MNEVDLELKELERRVYGDRARDGIFELNLGLVYLLFGLMVSADATSVFGAVAIIPFFLIPAMQRRITEGRLGTIEPNVRQELKKRRFRSMLLFLNLFLVVLGVLAFVVATKRGLPAWVRNLTPAMALNLFGLMLLVVMLFFGVMNGYQRVERHGLLGAVILFGTGLLPYPRETGFMLLGVVMLIWGGIALRRFLAAHPPLAMGDGNG